MNGRPTERPWIYGAISEPDGSASFTRIACSFVIGISTIWITVLVFKNGTLPDLGGVTLFDTGIVGILYGINKGAQVANSAVTGKETTKTS